MQGLGYRTSFMYGGYGYFDNMNTFYEATAFRSSTAPIFRTYGSRTSGA